MGSEAHEEEEGVAVEEGLWEIPVVILDVRKTVEGDEGVVVGIGDIRLATKLPIQIPIL